MYRVFLAEDEILERENYRESWIWKDSEFTLCGDAANGKDAWEQLQSKNIDILVTDIRMPFMDGLELSRLVREHMPEIKIIILSGYSEFKYARQALEIGVTDYIVKPIKSSQLLETMQKVVKQIDAERSIKKDIVRLQKQAELNRPIRINKFLDDLSLGIYSSDLMKKRAKELNLDIDANYYITMVIEFAEQKLLLTHNDHLLTIDVVRILKDIISNDPDVYYFRKDMHSIVVIFKGNESKQLQKKAVHLASRIRHAIIEKTAANKALFSIGGIREGLPGIAESLADAKLILDFKYLFSENDTIIMEQSLLKKINKTNGHDLSLNTETNLIENLLKFGSKDETKLVVDKLVSKLKTLQFSRIYYQYICMGLIKRIEGFLAEIGEDISCALKTEADNTFCTNQWLKWSNDINLFSAFLTKLLHRVIELREQNKNYKYSNFIAATVKYIDENYVNSALSLNDVASYANISSSYFSTLFSQEMGESFIDYLTRKRISRAKELLKTTSMRLIDIAFEVGYQDSNYFSKIFKKLTGMSPRDYRNS